MSNIFLNTARTPNGISVEWEIKGALPADIAKQLPYAASLALNRTAVEAVAVVRRETAKHFTRRQQSQEFFNQSFQVTQFSNKRNLEVAFGASYGLMQGRGASLLHHEDGTDRVAKSRNDFPYIPVIGSSLRRTSADLLPRWAYPKALGLTDSRYLANGKERGADRTPKRRGSTRGQRASENRKGFILRNKAGEPVGIFRRIPQGSQGRGGITLPRKRGQARERTTLEILFWTPKVIKIKPRLGFRRIADVAMVERIQANFEGMLAYAVDQSRQASTAAWLKSDEALVRQFLRGGR